jgi:hypothetical protein
VVEVGPRPDVECPRCRGWVPRWVMWQALQAGMWGSAADNPLVEVGWDLGKVCVSVQRVGRTYWGRYALLLPP